MKLRLAAIAVCGHIKSAEPGLKNAFEQATYRLESVDTENLYRKFAQFSEKGCQNIIGMDFEQFTSSMLLAQGNFSAFLQAGPNDRAPILEQITGTEIYSRISKKVFDLAKRKKSKILS